MAHTKTELTDKINALSTAHWNEANEPLFLSRLGPDLQREGFDYKEILTGQGLRLFIDKEVTELTIVKHPQQFAKIGVHPSDEDNSYTDVPVETKFEPSEFDELRKKVVGPFMDLFKLFQNYPHRRLRVSAYLRELSFDCSKASR